MGPRGSARVKAIVRLRAGAKVKIRVRGMFKTNLYKALSRSLILSFSATLLLN